MAMDWEEIAESRMREIRRLRAIVRCSTNDSVIIEHAANIYTMSKKAFSASRAAKADEIPLNEGEIKRMAEMQIIADLIADLDIMERVEFVEYAERELVAGNMKA